MPDYRVEEIKWSIKELRNDLQEFIATRLQIFSGEMKEKIAAWKAIIPMLGVALVCAVMALLVLTGALVYVIAMGIGIGYALLAVGIGYLLFGILLGGLGYREIARQGMAPKRTIHVLKQDQAWLQSEAKSQMEARSA